jgi:hypothetical protein
LWETRKLPIGPSDQCARNFRRRTTSSRYSSTFSKNGYAASLPVRKRIEQEFGWYFTFAAAAYNLFGLPKLLGATRLQSQQPFMVSTALASWFWVDSDPTPAIDATLP